MNHTQIIPSSDCQRYLNGHWRVIDSAGVNKVEQVIVGPNVTLVKYAPSHGDLHSYVRNKKRLSETEACPLFKQIVQIVAQCHEAGIVLRDLKLRKFVFADLERTQLKLESLDDAIFLDENPENDLLKDKYGCPAYVSPEILASAYGLYSGRAADCWSLGVILYTMLVGRYPFHDQDPATLFCKIRHGHFTVPATISPAARILIRSLLRREPSERLTAAEVLDDRWFQLMGSSETVYAKHQQLFCEQLQAEQLRQQQQQQQRTQSEILQSPSPSSSSSFSSSSSSTSSILPQVPPPFVFPSPNQNPHYQQTISHAGHHPSPMASTGDSLVPQVPNGMDIVMF